MSHPPETGAAAAAPPESGLERSLGPWMIWGLGVGYVISGEYFGWNLGLPEGGTYGMLAATALVTVMYVAFVLSYAEVACAVPRAGGAFVYADRAFGRDVGLLVGLAQLVEFVFAPPAIAAAIGAYFHLFVPEMPETLIAVGAYVLFVGLNIWGVKQSAIFELVVTVLAVAELLLFAGVALPHFDTARFVADPLPNGWAGVLPAIPFAIWFYLAIEGVANIAEEARDPQRDIPRGFLYAMGTLVGLAVLVFFAAVGVDGWHSVVFDAAGEAVDRPLPLALGRIVGENHPLYHLLVTVGLFGLVASFHGIILVAGRATLELGRYGVLPRVLGRTHATRHTPVPALLAVLAVGIAALLTGRTGEIITLSVFGALVLYIGAMASLFRLRRTEPELPRPYRAPLYPWLPALALVLALLCLVAVAVSAPRIGAVFVGLMAAGTALGHVLRDRD
ncbi:MAG: hypothetical protein RIT45_3967 [Pseudomonadota bacterium]|jgi:ethanolamine permease